MYQQADTAVWQGRVDAEAGAERWHQRVMPLAAPGNGGAEPGLALLGVCSDTGVKRNHGRVGAHKGPDLIRAALADQAWHLPGPCYDAGNLYCVEDDLEELQKEQAAWVEKLLDQGHFPLLLGGGHEISWGSHLGLRAHLERRRERGVTGIINFDAHFDLRLDLRSTSGTPFLQIAESCRRDDLPFRYLCLGVSEVANTSVLFQRAESLGAQWLLDEQLTPWNLGPAEKGVRDFLARCDRIHLSIDLDVLPACVAPGVSAPSPRGVALELVEHLLQVVKSEAGAKLRLADIAEYNPNFDMGGATAKVAARLCHLVARPHSGRRP